VADISSKPEGLTQVKECLIKRQILTPCWLRKCSNSSFLPHIPSAFQQARCRALNRSVLLGRGAIFGDKKNDSLHDSVRASYPCGEGIYGREEPTIQLHTCMVGKLIDEI